MQEDLGKTGSGGVLGVLYPENIGMKWMPLSMSRFSGDGFRAETAQALRNL